MGRAGCNDVASEVMAHSASNGSRAREIGQIAQQIPRQTTCSIRGEHKLRRIDCRESRGLLDWLSVVDQHESIPGNVAIGASTSTLLQA